jgi:hypothetical protein
MLEKNLIFKFQFYCKTLIIQGPVILGFLLPYIFYNDFFYGREKIDEIFVTEAFNFFLKHIIFLNILIVVLSFFVKKKNYKLNYNFIHFFGVISIISTIGSRLFDLNYYLNLSLYIAQFLILLNLLIIAHINETKKNIFTNCIYIIICCLISIYSGDSKYTLISSIIILISTINYLHIKHYLSLVLIFICISISVLGFKKIYRDLMFSGGMDKLNYTFDKENTTYTNYINDKKKSLNYDYFFDEKIEYLKFNKSYFFSNSCGKINYDEYRYKRIEILNNYVIKYKFNNDEVKNLIESNIENKLNTFCYLFFRFINRIDLLTQLSQSTYLLNNKSSLKGLSYKPIFYIPIPRFILKNKPQDNADDLWMSIITKIKDPLDKNRTIISVNPFTEAYMNFKNNGLYVIILIYFIIYLLQFYIVSSKNIALLAISYSLIIHIINTNLSAKQIFGGSYQLFVIYIVLFFTAYLFRKTELFSKVFLK